MIKEDYVSYEVAKLLREKGFDETCYACYEYFSSNITMYSGWTFEYKGVVVNNSEYRVKCPTHQMVLKWLREVHNLHCSIDYDYTLKWYCQITNLKETVLQHLDYEEMKIYHPEKDNNFISAEEATEAALKYCLENLI